MIRTNLKTSNSIVVIIKNADHSKSLASVIPRKC